MRGISPILAFQIITMQVVATRVYTPRFMRLCVGSLFFFVSFSMILPELPNYLSQLGGAEYKGFIISLFTLTAGISRPFSGKLADTIGRRPVMLFGVWMSAVCGMMYPLVLGVSGFLLLRLVHGFSTGFTPTGTTAFLSDIVPINRRGEALGILGLVSNVGTALGPAIGGEIAHRVSLDLMFYAGAFCGVISMFLLYGLGETLKEPQGFRWALLRVRRDEIIEPRVLAPAIVTFLVLFAFGSILTVVPDLCEHLGLQNKGLFFTAFTVSSLTLRFLAGKISDIYGRAPVLRLGIIVLIIALFWIAYAPNYTQLLIGGVIYGAAVGLYAPTIFAWAVDLSLEESRGKAISTVFIALEAGIGMGSILSAEMYANRVENFPITFLTPAVVALVGFIYLLKPYQYLLPRD